MGKPPEGLHTPPSKRKETGSQRVGISHQSNKSPSQEEGIHSKGYRTPLPNSNKERNKTSNKASICTKRDTVCSKPELDMNTNSNAETS
ncbi:hypothetical protein LIER_15865 [Lithospermum erythrorhizon]|uniref:Uncharacterized protein n=1 Tax=Lithospermum erythrorhizon TaxID=34254 RepID=A0AAV3Q4I1_LITER